ncbi:MAG: hypothetical protein ACK4P2_08825 [Hyphomonas sp.]
MKTMMMIAAAGLMAAAGGCRSSAPPPAYANPIDACAGEATLAERDECMKNIVADVALSVKREAERKPQR